MIAGETLAAWLADRGEQQRSYGVVEQFVRKWSASPLFGEFERDLSLLNDRSAPAILSVARRFIDRTREFDAMFAELLAHSAADPFFRPAFHPLSSEIHSGLLVFNHPDVSVGFGVTGVDMLAAKKAGRRGPASIGFTGVWNLFRYVKAGDAIVSFWEAPKITDRFTAAEAGECRLVERRRIHDGEEIVIDGSYQSFIVEHATSDMLYFQAMVRTDAAPLTTEYDSATRAFIGASSTDEAASRVQMMASLLRAMDREDAAPLLREALATSPHFYTRWHLMRELLALDAEAAYPDLKTMAESDPHPEIRAAAAQTLAMFFADAEAEEPVPCPA